MTKRILEWVLIGGCVFFLMWAVADRINYWWAEKTYGPRYRSVDMCKRLDGALRMLAEDGQMPPPEGCLAEIVKRDYVPAPAITDAWGHAFEVQVATNGSLQVWSPGPDGVRGTLDDVNAESHTRRPHSGGGWYSGM